MQNTQLEVGALERLRGELEALPGVQRAIVEGAPPRIHLLCATDAPPATQRAAQDLLAREGMADEAEVQIAYLGGGPAEQRRVKFLDAVLEHPRAGVSRAAVALEWRGQTYRAEEEGEGGVPLELRVAARATLHALEDVLEGAVHLELVGIKFMRVFDNDMVAVLVRCEQAPDRRLIGVALVDEQVARTAALAVLNATNRLLGNFLPAA